MFTLRIIDEVGEFNTFLGKNYSYIRESGNRKVFESLFENCFGEGSLAERPPQKTDDSINPDKIYAFITGSAHQDPIPLYSDQQYYIMSESGQTFSNVGY